MAKRRSGATRATALLESLGISYDLHAYDHDPKERDFGAEAARKLGVPAERVLKTLVTTVDGALTIAIVPVAHQLDLKALAVARGGKRAKLADPEIAEAKTGFVVGGISPLGQRSRLPTVLDVSALAHATVLVSGGLRGVDLELAPRDLVRATGAVTARIAR